MSPGSLPVSRRTAHRTRAACSRGRLSLSSDACPEALTSSETGFENW